MVVLRAISPALRGTAVHVARCHNSQACPTYFHSRGSGHSASAASVTEEHQVEIKVLEYPVLTLLYCGLQPAQPASVAPVTVVQTPS